MRTAKKFALGSLRIASLALLACATTLRAQTVDTGIVKLHTYAELKRQIHEDLRMQHPEWVLPDGKCPECDEHESRLRELLEAPGRIESTTEGPAIDGKGSNNPGSP